MEIYAKIIADSESEAGDRITTFELQYPRFIHSEFMTHRLFSRNAASSRAIPIDKMIEQIENDPAMPVYWGLNQSGMQAGGEHNHIPTCVYAWKQAAKAAAEQAKQLRDLGLHKQIVNRVLEPFQWMKTVMTTTEIDNFFWLRNHKDAQPEIQALAHKMLKAYKDSTPNLLKEGEWHLPYVSVPHNESGMDSLVESIHTLSAGSEDITPYNMLIEAVGGLDNALKISASCCAQVSFRSLDDDLEKAERIYKRLVESKPVHASPFEHQAAPIRECKWNFDLKPTSRGIPKGITHQDREGYFWSGNLQGWLQHRQLLEDHVCWDYEE